MNEAYLKVICGIRVSIEPATRSGRLLHWKILGKTTGTGAEWKPKAVTD